MAKAKELTIRDIFMKLERFTKDCFIIHNRCFIEGEEGVRIGAGRVFGYFDESAAELFKNNYPDADLLEVINVRNAKDDPEHNIKVIPERMNKAITEEDFKSRYDRFRCVNWTEFNFSDEELDALFNQAERIEYEILPGKKVQLTKGLFPSMTIKRATELVYYAELLDNDKGLYPADIIHAIVRIESEHFTAFLEYRWLDV